MSDHFRKLAGQYHGGQFTALYVYNSSGTILPELSQEIKDSFKLAPSKRVRSSLMCFYAAVAAPIDSAVAQYASEFWHRSIA